MAEILTIASFAIGGLFMPLLCAALAMKKCRSANRWLVFGCLGLYVVPLVGSLVVLIILACLPKGTEPADTQKLMGLSVSPKSMLLASCGLAVLFAFGVYGLLSSIMTIVNAIRWE